MAVNAPDASGVSPQTLSLPKGGGAIHGLGEKFEPDLHTGTGNFSIQLSLPPARHSLAPELTLSYTTGAGNGAFGLGWSLGIPNISRKISKGVPVYDDERDTFMLSVADELVPVNRVAVGTKLTTTYRPRREGLFARIAHVVDGGQNYWDVTYGDGIRSIYGATMNGRVSSLEDGAEHIFAWYLEKTEDRFGNSVLYHYQRDTGPNPPELNHRYHQVYLTQIEYCNYLDEPTGADRYLFQVDLDYGDFDAAEVRAGVWAIRPDPFSSYRAGFEIRTVRRCERILIRSMDPTANAPTHLIRSYDLRYIEDQLCGVSLLHAVVHRGYCTARPLAPSRDWDLTTETDVPGHRHRSTNLYVTAFPPVSFSYSGFAPERRTVQALSFDCDRPPEHALGDPDYDLVDLYGNGLPDILRTTPTGHYCWRNLGRGRFAGPRRLQSAPFGVTLKDGGVQLADMRGKGSADLLVGEGIARGFYENDFSGEWGRYHSFTQVPSFDLKDPNVRLVDLDGDGVIDVLATLGHHFLYIRNCSRDGHLEFAPPLAILRHHDLDAWPDVFFAQPQEGVRLGDMSGDGLQDIVMLHEGRVDYWPNLGHGRWGRRITLMNGPHLPWRYDPKRLFLADINGDGLADLVYVDAGSVRYWINQSGNRWSDEQVIACTPQVTNFDTVRMADVNGTGAAGIVWSSNWSSVTREANYRYLSFTGGEKPLLLNSIDNHSGAVTRIEYRPSTEFYVADQEAGSPWRTSLPFPVNVVAKVTVHDGVTGSQLTSRYTYHHGYWDRDEREYRGFGRVDQYDADVFEGGQHASPPALTRSWFHTGAYAEGAQISQEYVQEYYREDSSAQHERGAAKEPASILLDDTVLPLGLTADESREACRILNGSLLRQEVYAVDGTARAGRPYTVSERNYTLRMLQPRGEHTCAVFFSHPRETVDLHYERTVFKVVGDTLAYPRGVQDATDAADPRVTHVVNLSADDFGNILQFVSIGYGRRFKDASLTPADIEAQRQTRVTYTENRYTNPLIEADTYHAPLPCETRTFELLKLTPGPAPPHATNLLRFEQLEALAATPDFSQGAWDIPYQDVAHAHAAGSHVYRRQIEHVRTLYRKDDLSGPLPLGELQAMALPFESYRLAFTPDLANRVYVDSGRLSAAELQAMLAGEGGYVHSEGDGNWWIPSGQIFYSPGGNDTPVQELGSARRHFFQPQRFRDPFGATTTHLYDVYDLLLQETRDPLNNCITAGERDGNGNLLVQGNDYRVLQPRLVMDPNRNRSAVEFDGLGLVTATALMGKPEEVRGDSLDAFDPLAFDAAAAGYLQDPFADPHQVLQGATTRLVYDLFAYWRTRSDQQPRPAMTAMLVREIHASDLARGEQAGIQRSFAYSDGFGREIQKKLQAEPGPLQEGGLDVHPRWVGSGWTVFSNKGKPVRRYEPFFSSTHQFEHARSEGVSSVLCYDALGRVVAALHPNHTYEKVVFDPWQQSTWDVNDTATLPDPGQDVDVGSFFGCLPDAAYLPTWHQLRTNPALAAEAALRWPSAEGRASETSAAAKTAAHANTPTRAYLDSLGRPFLQVTHNRTSANLADEFYATRTELDIEGNQRAVLDAENRAVMLYEYDMLGGRVRQASMDAGERWMLQDATGKPIRVWDGRGHTFRTRYDALGRACERFVTGIDPQHPAEEILYEKTEYGEGRPGDTRLNLRTRVFRQHDGAGVITHLGLNPSTSQQEAYDFKGNLLRSSRQLTVEYRTRPDWSAGPPLQPPAPASTTFDALNRPVSETAPDGSVTRRVYSMANLLQRVEVNLRGAQRDNQPAWTPIVTNIDYNARGQPISVTYGNGVSTAYSYAPETFRLSRVMTTRPAGANGSAPRPLFKNPAVVQDLRYTTDPVGNITRIVDDALAVIFYRNQQVEPVTDYVCDASYRLISATGREQVAQSAFDVPPASRSRRDYPFRGLRAQPDDPAAVRRYTETYDYDPAGNIRQLAHVGRWTRSFAYLTPSLIEPGKLSNRLTRTTVNNSPETYSYADAQGRDVNGCVTAVNATGMAWDFEDRLQSVDLGGGGTAYYAYDAAGERVRKVIERHAGVRQKERIYLGDFEIYREYSGNGHAIRLERQTLHISDRKQCVALVETRTVDVAGHDRAPVQLVRYQFSNHLGSTCVELDDQARLVSFEEYTPFGSTCFQAVRSHAETPKRYRYTGKERDNESGLYYYGARYYMPWLGRWASCDPLGTVDGTNLYAYAQNAPGRLLDLSGEQATQWQTLKPLGIPQPQGDPTRDPLYDPETKKHKASVWERDPTGRLDPYYIWGFSEAGGLVVELTPSGGLLPEPAKPEDPMTLAWRTVTQNMEKIEPFYSKAYSILIGSAFAAPFGWTAVLHTIVSELAPEKMQAPLMVLSARRFIPKANDPSLLVGTYNTARALLRKLGATKLFTPHHAIQNAMSPVSHGRGITIILPKYLHELTESYCRRLYGLSLRQALAVEVKNLHLMLNEAGGYHWRLVNRQLRELIRQNKALWRAMKLTGYEIP